MLLQIKKETQKRNIRLLPAIIDSKLTARVPYLALLDFLYKQSVFIWIKLKNLQYDKQNKQTNKQTVISTDAVVLR